MNKKQTYYAPETEVVFLENEGMMCQSDQFATDKFEWDDAMDL